MSIRSVGQPCCAVANSRAVPNSRAVLSHRTVPYSRAVPYSTENNSLQTLVMYNQLYNTNVSRPTFREGRLRALLGKAGAQPSRHEAISGVKKAVLRGMAALHADFAHPKTLPSVSTDELRRNLSHAINQAAFGDSVLVTRRGRKIAAIISIVDLEFLEKMKQRREEALAEKLPADESQVGAAMARRLGWEIFFG